MNPLYWQADEALSDTSLRVIGALRTFASRIQFFLGVPNTLMIAVLFYNDSALIQSVVPTVYHWVALILFGLVPAAVAIDRVVLHPAQIVYNAGQTDLSDRSPNFEETVKARERVDELHQRLDQMDVPRACEEVKEERTRRGRDPDLIDIQMDLEEIEEHLHRHDHELADRLSEVRIQLGRALLDDALHSHLEEKEGRSG